MKTKALLVIAGIVCASALTVFWARVDAANRTPAGGAHSMRAQPQQNPVTSLEDAAKEKAEETAIETLLNDQLPLTLNAKDVYPTVKTLPGAPFNPKPLQLTADHLDQPIPPGDYTVNMLDFCSQYSIHRPGQGVAYVLGPLQGKAADAIGYLIWRGTVQYNIAAPTLQTVSWAIQSGLTYQQMPQSYQQIIDQVIPDYKSEITGDFMQNLQNEYAANAKTLNLPPLDTLLAKMGPPGQLALDAEKERAILLQTGTSDQLKDQTLYQGQESGVYTPVKAEDGPWTERVPNQVYMKLLIQGGNMNTNNVVQIRVMPTASSTNGAPSGVTSSPLTVSQVRDLPRRSPDAGVLFRNPYFLLAAYSRPAARPRQVGGTYAVMTTMSYLIRLMIGYAQGQGAQALAQVPFIAPPPKPAPPAKPQTGQQVGSVVCAEGDVSVIHPGETEADDLDVNDPIVMGDKIVTGPQSRACILFQDKTEFTLSEKASLVVNDYVYDPTGHQKNTAKYGILEGMFQYVSGLLAKQKDADINIDTPYGNIGVRGTEFIVKSDGTPNNLEIDLISGSIALTPNAPGAATAGAAPAAGQTPAAGPTASSAPTITGPIQILITPSGQQTLPLTQAQYNSLVAQYFPGLPIS
jgi:hypothetical protein